MPKNKPKKKQMMRNNDGKPMLSFILDFPHALKELAFVMEGGMHKYERNNWKEGAPITEIEDSLLRHLLDFHNCQNADSESKRHHLAHVIFNAAGIIEHMAMYGDQFDNRDWENNFENDQ